jgi:penicillin-binding protein 2
MGNVKDGMIEMVNLSSKARVAFKDFPEGFVAAKAGTPETGLEAFGQSSHSVLICYAPANDPEIAVAIVIEHGASGGNSLSLAAEIMKDYFGM